MGGKVRNAADFFKKYGLDNSFRYRIDWDLTREGIQNDAVDIDRLVRDYDALSPADRYAVFVRLRKGGDDELLKRIGHFERFEGKFAGPVVYIDEAFAQVLSQIRSDVESATSIWEKRIKLAEGLFAIDILLAAYTSAQGGSVRDRILIGLQMFYREGGAGGNPLFDTDGDLDPYADMAQWNGAFDDKDVLPLDPERNMDRDHNGMDDRIQGGLSRLKVGHTIDAGNYSITRVSGNEFEISRTFTVRADDKGDRETILRDIISDEALARRKKEIEEAFTRAVEEGKYRFRLNINFRRTEAFADATFSDRDIRSTGNLWGGGLLSSPDRMLHEVFHLFGHPDYYHEANVASGVRDFTTRPGFGVLGARHLMS